MGIPDRAPLTTLTRPDLSTVAPGKATLSCADLDAPGHGCCTSCHEDEELGYAPIDDYDLIDGRSARVCCATARSLAAYGWRKHHTR